VLEIGIGIGDVRSAAPAGTLPFAR
jgi:hypothetical protein